uniref:Why2 protein n=1 Tax=Solanum tuberosum TaxID=4113 RepID=M1CDL7_SOLTU
MNFIFRCSRSLSCNLDAIIIFLSYLLITGKREGRVFAPYSVFKGKAALSAEPRLPTFNRLDSGGVKLNRRGVIMLTFWPSVGERKYDWEKRQAMCLYGSLLLLCTTSMLFALSATEVGSLISMGTRDSSEFFHDPSMLSSNAGQVRKSLSIKPNADGSGYFISLSISLYVHLF